jgi:hypothetical protein
LADEFAAAADAGLVEDGLQVVLDRVRRHVEGVCHLLDRHFAQAQLGDLAFAVGEAVGHGDQGCGLARQGWLEDDSDAPGGVSGQRCAVEQKPVSRYGPDARAGGQPERVLAGLQCSGAGGNGLHDARLRRLLGCWLLGQLSDPALQTGEHPTGVGPFRRRYRCPGAFGRARRARNGPADQAGRDGVGPSGATWPSSIRSGHMLARCRPCGWHPDHPWRVRTTHPGAMDSDTPSSRTGTDEVCQRGGGSHDGRRVGTCSV